MLIVGTIVGAGFVSGREIISFFGHNASPWTAVLVAVLIFAVSFLFLFIGSRLNSRNVSEVNVKLAGRFHIIADAFLLVNSFIVLAAMLAAMDSLGNSSLLPIAPVYSIVTGILCVFVVCKGVKGLIQCNKAVVPLMAFALVFIGIFTVLTATGGGAPVAFPSFGVALVYICMNMVLASTVITTLGRMNLKTMLLSSGLAGIIMGALVAVLMAALNAWGETNADMPVLAMSRQIHPVFFYAMVIIIAASIFTTMLAAMSGLVAWFEGIFGGKLFSAFVILAGGFILSNLGFSTVVKYFYPVIGVFGVVYVFLGCVFAARTLPVFKRITRSEKRKNTIATLGLAGRKRLSSNICGKRK